jgi:hypothetical protein
VSERRRHIAQQIVARCVTEPVVEQLESVEVEHQEREAPARSAMPLDLIIGAHQQRPAVGDPGHRIAERIIAQQVALALQPLACGDVDGD